MSLKNNVVEVNMRDEANPKPIFISERLSPSEEEDLIYIIREYIDVFPWNYEDMPGLDPQIVMHRLNINPDTKPVKQQRLFRLKNMEVIEEEVKKLIDSRFVREDQHPDWMANIIHATKNGKIQICIDFHDLNTACAKDEFSLPITDVMINTC